MTRRRLSVLLIVLGTLVIVAAVSAAAIMRSSDTATLALPERPEQSVVVTMPGVLDAVDPTVTVRGTAEEDEQVVLAIGRTAEVEAWLGDAEHLRVSGLSSWEELTTEVVTAEEPDADEATDEEAEDPAAAGLPDPAGSDLWVAEEVGTGDAELTWTDSPGRWSLVAATDGTGPAPVVELEWGREVTTPWLVPGIVLGAGLLVAGIVLVVLRRLAEREQRRRDAAREERTDTGSIIVSVTDTDPGTGERLSRRQIREMERAMAQADRRRRGAAPPPVPLPPDEPPPVAPGSEEVAGAAEVSDHQPSAGEHDEVSGAAEPTSPEPPPAPSWRSVWGFAGTSLAAQTPQDDTPALDTQPRRAPDSQTPQDTDGEEER